MKHLFACLLALSPTVACADPATIDSVEAIASASGWSFSVTLSHGDTGWEDYADGWRIIAPDGTVLGTRVLAHPHVNEQPFTRSLGGVRIPDSVDRVTVQSSTKAEGWSGQSVDFALPN